jgi:hypothetical protein
VSDRWRSGDFSLDSQGWLWFDGDIPGGGGSARLTPGEAVNLASALLQYATQNADWLKVNGEAE